MLPAPFAPLVAGGEGLEAYPAEPVALAARMAEIYGVAPDCVLPVRGITHGLELAWRLAARDGAGVQAPDGEPYSRLTSIYGRASAETAVVVAQASEPLEAIGEKAAALAPALLVIDEGRIEFDDLPSAASLIGEHPNLVVLRSLSLAYGLAGARIGAALAQPAALARLRSVMEPYPLPLPSVRLAMQALDPSRMMETTARIAAVRRERARLENLIPRAGPSGAADGPAITLETVDRASKIADLVRYGIDVDGAGDALRVPVSMRREVNDRLLAALGVPGTSSSEPRTGLAVRDTRETRLVCSVDLNTTSPVQIQTGVGFFDHMLEQVALHGGFSLRLCCEGDLHTDPHHTIEDSAIVLGQALKQALGERRGIARYGFVLPMDEANAAVSIDLSGRPYPIFEGAFSTPFLGGYRTDMTAHVFRSLAEHLGAAIHITVTGEDDHHKTEAVYKAFGRALRQAIRIESNTVPSSKGVL